MQKQVLVIKLGTAVITDKEGLVNSKVLKKVAKNIATLAEHYNVVLVSSGAVGSGKAFIHNYKGTLTERKAAAAVGNPVLINLYQKYFSLYNIPVAQALCERHHFSNRTQFIQLKETFKAFWNSNIIPIVNENDLVSNVELKFSDNDELATLIAVGFNAETLIICTSVGGFLNHEKEIIPVVSKIDDKVMGYISQDKSSVGLGGMISKITFAKLAVSLGIRVIICGLTHKEPFVAAMAGSNGTIFKAQPSNLKARQKWLVSGSITLGSMTLDAGAAKALNQGRSLLTVGIKTVIGSFSMGEVVQLMDENKNIIGVAKSKLSAEQVAESLAEKNKLAAHANDIVVFN